MSIGAILRPLVEAYAGSVPEIAARLSAAGLSASSSDEELAGLPLLRKSDLAARQAASPPWGGLLEAGCVPTAAFMSTGGVVEPLVPRMVERLASLLRAAGFGPGQVILVDGQVLILSDAGELVLVKAVPDSYHEVARAKVLDGKCWTTPVVSNGRVYARSTKEAVCLDVSPKSAAR